MVSGRVFSWAAICWAIALAITGSGSLAASTARVDVEIQILPIAVVDFPDGLDFVLRVPHTPHCPPHRDGRNWSFWTFWNKPPWRFDRDYWAGWLSRSSDWRRWKDDDWDSWGSEFRWEDWDDDIYRRKWFNRCKSWLSSAYWPVIRPVRIPFTVRGNASASVTVTPEEFLQTKSGSWLGRAGGPAYRSLGYDAIVHFPVSSSSYRWLTDWEYWDDWDNWSDWRGFGTLPWWSRWTRLPRDTASGTPPLPANLPELGNRAFGVIYAVARRHWTPDGSAAPPGLYHGSVLITVTAD